MRRSPQHSFQQVVRYLTEGPGASLRCDGLAELQLAFPPTDPECVAPKFFWREVLPRIKFQNPALRCVPVEKPSLKRAALNLTFGDGTKQDIDIHLREYDAILEVLASALHKYQEDKPIQLSPMTTPEEILGQALRGSNGALGITNTRRSVGQ